MNRYPLSPGAYDNIPMADYHGVEICQTPSISSSGLKLITQRSPLHYWHQSPLNPNRPAPPNKSHFRVGSALHDLVLMGGQFPDSYHILPPDFSRARTKAQADQIAAADAAEAAGLTVITAGEAESIKGMAKAILANRFAKAALTNGKPEVTLIWKDPVTGVALRVRPDFLPHKRLFIGDVKTAADASPDAFRRAMASHGYHQSAALYMDGIEAVFGEAPRSFFFIVVEKEPPHCVALYEIPADDIHRGRMLNRRAIDTFARCLKSGKFPGYADDVMPLPLPSWEQRQIDQAAEAGELSYAA